MRTTPTFSIHFWKTPVSQIMIIQELYFQNYYNLGNLNRNPPGKTKWSTFRDGQMQHEDYPTFSIHFFQTPVSQIMIIQELYFQNYYNLGNPARTSRKNKMANFPRWPNATYGLLHFFYPFLQNPRFPKL